MGCANVKHAHHSDDDDEEMTESETLTDEEVSFDPIVGGRRQSSRRRSITPSDDDRKGSSSSSRGSAEVVEEQSPAPRPDLSPEASPVFPRQDGSSDDEFSSMGSRRSRTTRTSSVASTPVARAGSNAAMVGMPRHRRMSSVEEDHPAGLRSFIKPMSNRESSGATTLSASFSADFRQGSAQQMKSPLLQEDDDDDGDDFDVASNMDASRENSISQENSLDLLDSDEEPMTEELEFYAVVKASQITPTSSKLLSTPFFELCTSCNKKSPVPDAKFCCFCGSKVEKVSQDPFEDASDDDDHRRLSSWSSVAEGGEGSPMAKLYVRKVHISRMKDSVLGKGTSGIVYRAFDTVTGTPLAVKEVKANLESKDEVKKMKRELRQLSRLRHPNVIQYYGCHVKKSPPRVCILTERLECGSLQQMLDGCPGGLSVPVVRTFIHQLLRAVFFCHSNKVTHRDIKPANMLLTSNGVVKLMDFGSALDHVMLRDREEGEGVEVAGTPAYMPPEVMQAARHQDSLFEMGCAHDVWAIGCCAHQLLTGKVPWSELGQIMPFALVSKIATLRRFQISPTLPAHVVAFLEQCFEPDWLERSSATELLQSGWMTDHTASTPTSPRSPAIFGSSFSSFTTTPKMSNITPAFGGSGRNNSNSHSGHNSGPQSVHGNDPHQLQEPPFTVPHVTSSGSSPNVSFISANNATRGPMSPTITERNPLSV